jgi:SAM-dependent methyltransferase
MANKRSFPEMDYKVDAENAELFEAGMVPAWFGPCARELVRLAAPSPGERVLDLACGTGVAAREVATVLDGGGTIIGCDLNQTMLDVACEVAAREGHNIDFRQGDAGDLPFEDGTFDLVLCQQGFQFFPDRLAALREIKRVLAPSGRMVAAIWISEAHCPGQLAIIQALEKHGIDAAAARRPFAFGDEAQIRAVFGGEWFPSLEISSVRLTSHFDSPEHCIEVLASGAPSLRMAIEQAAPEIRGAIREEAARAMASYTSDRGVEIPMESYLLLGRLQAQG